MTAWNISASGNATTVNGLPSGVDNDQGTIRGGGNVSATSKFSADAVNLGISRSVTVPSGLSHISSPLAAGQFNSGDKVIRKVTTDIANVSNSVLLTGASNTANASQSINQMRSYSTHYYKTAVRTGGWHEFSGVFSPAVTVANSGGWNISAGVDQSSTLAASGTDNAANPSASIPGELVYRDGKPLPVQDDYDAKTSY